MKAGAHQKSGGKTSKANPFNIDLDHLVDVKEIDNRLITLAKTAGYVTKKGVRRQKKIGNCYGCYESQNLGTKRLDNANSSFVVRNE
jgi:hypothetical protein